MQTFTRQQRERPGPAAAGGGVRQTASEHAPPQHDERAASVSQRALQADLNESPRVQTQLQLGQTLNAGPRAVAQAKLAATLAERPTTPAAELVAQRQTADDEELVAQRQTTEDEETPTTQTKCSSVAGCDEAEDEEGAEEEMSSPGLVAPVQGKFGDASEAAVGGGTKGGLPAGLRAGIEALSGVSVADVKVEYNSAEPAKLGALATTQGREIKLGRGQERHLAHEAWHAAQQKQGRVRATTQLRQTPVNDDHSLEREADVMGARAANMRAPAQLRCDGNCPTHAGRVLHRETTGEGTLQGKFVYKDFDLGDYIDDIAEYIKDNHDEDLAESFRNTAATGRKYNFDTWAKAKSRQVDWEQVLIDIVGFDPAWEKELFGQRLEGMPLSGFVPVATTGGKKTKMLEQVPRSGPGQFDYTLDEDMRILQTLRQISSQFYVYLEAAKKLAKDEQEIQAMWAYGNLILASNVPATLNTLYTELTTLGKGVTASDQLYNVLTGTYTPKKFLGVISERHGAKLDSLYQSMREFESDNLQEIVKALVGAKVSKITNVTDPTQIAKVADGTGNVYLLTSASPGGLSHAEQRLIEFRNLLQVYKQDPKAWVAGKKRPCFMCWIKERLTNKEESYELVYMDQPGKVFMGTYRAAEPGAKKEAYESLQDQSVASYESQVGRGEIGPESESEPEDEIAYQDPAVLMDDLSSKKLPERRRRVIKKHIRNSGYDPEKMESYLLKRKQNPSEVDTDEEDNLENAAKKLKADSESSLNPGFRKAFNFKTPYKKKVTPKKKQKQPTTP